MNPIYASIVAVGLALLLQTMEGPSAATHLDSDARIALGGCSNTGCDNKTCDATGCQYKEEFCTKVDTKCRKVTSNPFARCGGAKDKYNCSEVSGGGCVVIMTGDQTATNTCPEANCTPSGSTCGSTKYTCTATACGS
ncbi:MAG: hypothetical protein U0941_21145 [Planctomycetaceae bacterium]